MRILSVLFLLHSLTFSFAQENASVIEQNTIYKLSEDGSAEIEESYKIKINNEKGIRYAVFQEFVDKFRKLTDITITVYNKNGEKIKRLKRNEGHEYGFNSSYEITDGKIFVLDSDFKDFPFTIEVKSRLKIDGFTSLPPWMPRSYFNLSVNKASLSVIYPKSMRIKMKSEHIDSTRVQDGDNLTVQYAITNLPAIEKKIRYKDFYDAQSKVFVCPEKFQLDNSEGSNQSWTDFGQWYLTLNNESYELTPETKNFIASLDKGNPKLAAQKIYEYMQDKTRYVSIQLGVGGFKSLPTEEVEKYGYGDCKALSTYMKNMLDHAGIKSNYILVKAGEDAPDIMSNFPSNQFNHVFIGVPLKQDTLYLECTSQMSPFNYTGTFTDDRHVLWIADNKSKIIRSRIYSHDKSVKISKMNIQLSEDGNSTVEYLIDNYGIFFDDLMIYQMAPEGYVKSYNESKFKYEDFTIKDFTFQQPLRNEAHYQSTYKISVSNFAKVINGKLLVSPNSVSQTNPNIESDELMQYYSIPRAFTLQDEISITIPENYWLGNTPKPEKINSPYGSFEYAIESSAESIQIKKKIILFKGDYTKEEYQKFKQFFEKIEKIEKTKLLFNSKT
jgi:hypothetical protein